MTKPKTTVPKKKASTKSKKPKTPYTTDLSVSRLQLLEYPELRDLVSNTFYTLKEEEQQVILEGCKQLIEGARHRDMLRVLGMDFTKFNQVVRKGKMWPFYVRSRELAREVALALAEDEAMRRAVDGYKEEVYANSGKFAGYKTRYSDSLLTTLLKALDPDRFADRQKVQHSGAVFNMNIGIPNRNGKDITEDVKVS